MDQDFALKLVSSGSEIQELRAISLKLRDVEGEFEVLAMHINSTFVVKAGRMEILDHDRQRILFFITGGTLDVSDNKCTVIGEKICKLEEITQAMIDNRLHNLKQMKQSQNADNLMVQREQNILDAMMQEFETQR